MATVLGQTEVWLSGAQRAAGMLVAQSREIVDLSPGLAAVLLLNAAVARLLALDLDAARRTAEAAAELADGSGDAEIVFGTHAIAALCRFFAGEGAAAEQAIEPISQVAMAAVRESTDWRAAAIALLCAFAETTRGDVATAIDMLGPVIAADESHDLGRTVIAQMVRADALWRAGRWSECLAETSQLRSLHEATGWLHVRMCISATLARAAAGLGHADDCRRYADEAIADATQVGIGQIEAWAYASLGLLDLGAARYAGAAAHFDQVTRVAGHVREPGLLCWLADAVDAYHGCGRAADAAHALSRLEQQAAATGRRWAVAAAARAAAVVHPGEDAEAAFATALEGFRALRAPLEEARTLLARAEHRMRNERGREAALDAAEARTIFDRLGARDWSERATTLRGEPAGAATSLATRLTPAELRVALVVGGQGLSSREVAAELYVSTRTVEYHLQNIYRKLDIGTRSQLAALLAAERAAAG
jgi:DNA-binding CsgD family transcriptional regulator